MILMRVGRGEENVQITHEPARLQAQDAECAAEIMRKADPEWWGDIEIERLRERLETRFWLGIEQDGKIVSVGGMQFVDFASNINAIATDEAYRNRGFATSITSALVKEILKNSPAAIIHVLADNAPAVRAYSKVGFKPYKTYFSMHGDLIKT
jgi:predicted GNAT family acetyltransferase